MNLEKVLLDEANAKCKNGDHSWFDDSRFEGIAYRYEHTDKVSTPGAVSAIYSTKTCKFCGHSQCGLDF